MVRNRLQKQVITASNDSDDTNASHAVPLEDQGHTSRKPRDRETASQSPKPQKTRKATTRKTNTDLTSAKNEQNTFEKPRRNDKPQPSNNKSIQSFFGRLPPGGAQVQSSACCDAEPTDEGVADAIEDNFHQQLGVPRQTSASTSTSSRADRKRSWSYTNEQQTLPARQRGIGPKFLKSTHAPSYTAPETNTRSSTAHGSWNEEYSPKSLEELAVHPKKVADVRTWLEGVFLGRVYQRLLVLKGPSGAGKTSTVELLARSLGASLLEWHNPDLNDINSTDYVSWSSQFAEFISRSAQFNRLDITTSSGESDREDGHRDQQYGKRIIVIEEFPSTGGSSSAVTSFREQLLQFLAANSRAHSSQHTTPLIVCLSETFLSGTNPADQVTAHRLLGRELLHHPATTVIEFNIVAPTIITKALKGALQKHTRVTGRAQPVSPAIIQRIAEVGDVRSAVSTLEYLCRNLDQIDIHNISLNNARHKSNAKSSRSLKSSDNREDAAKTDEAAMSVIAGRESSLGLFHAVGKVVYNKRDESQGAAATQHIITDKPRPVLDADTLLATAGTDSSTFLSALHENYILSCRPANQPVDNEVTLGHVEKCLEALSQADVLGTSASGVFETGTRQRMIAEGLRQDEIANDAGVRGIYLSLPYPVKRISADGQDAKPKQHRPDANRMFYPTDIKLWRKREEIKESIKDLIRHVQHGNLTVDRSMFPAFHLSQGGIKDFPKQPIHQPGRIHALTSESSHRNDTEQRDLQPEGSVSRHSRLEALLDTLAYYAIISSALLTSDGSGMDRFRVREDLENAVKLKGTGIRPDEESEDEMDLSTSRKHKLHHSQTPLAFSMRGSENPLTFAGEVEKMVLSDDDIVD